MTNPNDIPWVNYGMTEYSPFATYQNVVGTPKHLKSGSVTVKLEGGSYDPQSLAKHMSDQLQLINSTTFNGNIQIKSGTDLLIRSIAQTPKQLFAYEINSIPVEEKGYSYSTSVPYWLGASQCSLVYGQDADLGDIFAWEYLHTPFFSPDKKLSVVMFGNDETKPKDIVSQQTGIFLTSVQPESFFTEQLGFQLSDITVNLSTGTGGIKFIASREEFDRVTTRGYFGIQGLFPDGNRIITDIAPALYIDSPNTEMLLGTSRNLDPQGHYLVELTFGNTGQKYIFQNGSLSHVFAIISRQYVNDGFIYAESDSAIPYTHMGSSFNLQNVKIRILDPITKTPITTLGDNSSLYLQIDKRLEQIKK